MRLIELRLKNLNSLKGEWHIDFSDNAFVDEGIFAITGQTGAGKTTILDAICLALYGETPRINSISKTSNEVMTRQTGDCYAEVVIELNGDQYRCRWGQRRAYNKADGKLQDATHEIAKVNLDDPNKGDEILESGLKPTKLKINELTSMDFQQFTRSILLAQGSFSAFLQAKPDERADILEKITGTDIYATISKNTHEKHRAEKEELERMQAISSGLSLLDVDTEQQYREDVNAYGNQLNTKKITLTNIEAQIKWLEDVASLQTQSKQFESMLEDANQAKKAFKADAQRLDEANRALEIKEVFNKLNTYRISLAKLKTDKDNLEEKRPKIKEELAIYKARLDNAIHAEQTANIALTKALPLIDKTRKLDAKIAQQQHSLTDKKAQHSKLKANIDAINHQIESLGHTKQLTQKRLNEADDYVAHHRHHSNLAADIESFTHLGKQLNNSLKSNADKEDEKHALVAKLAHYTNQLNNLEHQNTDTQSTIVAKKSELETCISQHNNLLQGQTPKSLRNQQQQLEHGISSLDNIRTLFQQLSNSVLQVKNTCALLPNKLVEIDNSLHMLKTNASKLEALKTERHDKTDNLNLLQQVAKLEDFIYLLKDDSPCPLCGSLEHPYVQGQSLTQKHPLSKATAPSQPSAIEQIQQRLLELTTQIKQLESAITQEKINVATNHNQCQHLQTQVNQELNQALLIANQLNSLTATLQADLSVYFKGHLNNDNDHLNNDAAPISSQLNAQLNTHLNALSKNALEALTAKLATYSDNFAKAWVEYCAQDAVEDGVKDSIISILQIESLKEGLNDLDKTIDTLSANTSMLKHTLTQQKNHLSSTLDDNDKFTQDINDLEQTIKSLEHESQAAKIGINDANTNLKLTSQQLNSVEDCIDSNFKEMAVIVQAMRHLVTQYKNEQDDSWSSSNQAIAQLKSSVDTKQVLNQSMYEPHLNALRTQCKSMKQLRDTYNKQAELAQSLKSEASNFATQMSSKQSQLNEAHTEFVGLTHLINELESVITNLHAHRLELYQNQDMDDEEQHLRLALENARNDLVQAKENYQTCEQNLTQLKQSHAKLISESEHTTQHLTKQKHLFASLLKDNNFEDEAAFSNALLQREERDALNAKKNKIDKNVEIARSRLDDTTKQLEDKLANPLVQIDANTLQQGNANHFFAINTEIKKELQQQLIDIQNDIFKLNRQIGALEQQLKTNAETIEQQRAQHKAIEAQKEVLRVWRNLHKLIGSVDGKKFRTFAQGLTFEVMVANANTQLLKMSDRYLLMRDEDSPLELNVIDNYQGGEIRSTKNLSGGEGFIISLALALGLSYMASHKISVDSLFLDEGFGTLDEDSLDIALDTLTSLQQEGKLIGVISHVQALKERIYTQIKVQKLSGGFSEIKGVGCQRIA